MFILARELGMTVRELSRRLGSDEYAEWVALFEIEGKEREHAEKMARSRRGRR